MGKLLYIQKTVKPARAFINRILTTFRGASHKQKIYLNKDIDWFLQFLPLFNGITFIEKNAVDDTQSLFLDASLTGMAFFTFLCMSNIAPHSKSAFVPFRHILRQDVLFLHPGAHILLKWTKTLQDRSAHHFVQIPKLINSHLCPVKAIQELMQSKPLPPHAPLFVHKNYPHHPVIDTTIRDALRTVLTHLHIPTRGHDLGSLWLLIIMSNYNTSWPTDCGVVQRYGIICRALLWLPPSSPSLLQRSSLLIFSWRLVVFQILSPKSANFTYFNYTLLTCKIKYSQTTISYIYFNL